MTHVSGNYIMHGAFHCVYDTDPDNDEGIAFAKVSDDMWSVGRIEPFQIFRKCCPHLIIISRQQDLESGLDIILYNPHKCGHDNSVMALGTPRWYTHDCSFAECPLLKQITPENI